jgi:osmoprotectant transport system substrate-binding protein/osmoprotectant transport system permease protein
MKHRLLQLVLLSTTLLATVAEPAAAPVVVGSKPFTESYILAEIMAQTLEAAGISVERRFGLGATLVTFQALEQGDIDVYPEYTGTLRHTILDDGVTLQRDELEAALQQRRLRIFARFGFDNSYAIAVRSELARADGLARISDLAHAPALRYAFSHEFLDRPDGWIGLKAAYGLTAAPGGIEHGLAYRALGDNKIDVTDAYATDGDIVRYQLSILDDDRGFFPEYRAIALGRADLDRAAARALATLSGRIDATTMRALNARVAVDGVSFAAAAADFLRGAMQQQDAAQIDPWIRQLLRNTMRHLELTGIALAAAIVVALLAGIAVHRSKSASRVVLYCTGLLQTIPSIALLALMIPLFGIGVTPAIIALFLYSLLPILRNTITALITIDPLLRFVAQAMGLTTLQQIRHVLLPLALPNVLAGVRTAAVICIGTATLAAFIGAGGLGDPIVTGLALNDTGLILQGAVPAALLALLTELGFEVLQKRIVPAHLISNRLPS